MTTADFRKIALRRSDGSRFAVSMRSSALWSVRPRSPRPCEYGYVPSQNQQVKAFVQVVTAAAVGAIAGAAYILARRSLIDVPTMMIGLVTLGILMVTKKVPEPVVILAAGAVGVLLHGRVG